MAETVLDYSSRNAEPAPLVRRFEASVTSAVPCVLWVFFSACLIRIGTADSIGGVTAHLAAVAVVYGTPVLLLALDGARTGATYGMRSRGVRLVRADGEELDYGSCFVRILLGIFLSPLLPVSAIVALSTPGRMTLADWIMGTVVIIDPDRKHRD